MASPSASSAFSASALSPNPTGAAEVATSSQAAAVPHAVGNLSIPAVKPASAGIAHALDGRWHAHR
jgi:hypothetical protein